MVWIHKYEGDNNMLKIITTLENKNILKRKCGLGCDNMKERMFVISWNNQVALACQRSIYHVSMGFPSGAWFNGLGMTSLY